MTVNLALGDCPGAREERTPVSPAGSCVSWAVLGPVLGRGPRARFEGAGDVGGAGTGQLSPGTALRLLARLLMDAAGILDVALEPGAWPREPGRMLIRPVTRKPSAQVTGAGTLGRWAGDKRGETSQAGRGRRRARGPRLRG